MQLFLIIYQYQDISTSTQAIISHHIPTSMRTIISHHLPTLSYAIIFQHLSISKNFNIEVSNYFLLFTNIIRKMISHHLPMSTQTNISHHLPILTFAIISQYLSISKNFNISVNNYFSSFTDINLCNYCPTFINIKIFQHQCKQLFLIIYQQHMQLFPHIYQYQKNCKIPDLISIISHHFSTSTLQFINIHDLIVVYLTRCNKITKHGLNYF